MATNLANATIIATDFTASGLASSSLLGASVFAVPWTAAGTATMAWSSVESVATVIPAMVHMANTYAVPTMMRVSTAHSLQVISRHDSTVALAQAVPVALRVREYAQEMVEV